MPARAAVRCGCGRWLTRWRGNTGYIIGAYRYGSNEGDTGKFTLTLKRVGDGPWLIFSDMDNTSAPPRAR